MKRVAAPLVVEIVGVVAELPEELAEPLLDLLAGDVSGCVMCNGDAHGRSELRVACRSQGKWMLVVGSSLIVTERFPTVSSFPKPAPLHPSMIRIQSDISFPPSLPHDDASP